MELEQKHPIFTKDPSAWMSSIGSVVEIRTYDGAIHIGTVYTVDPVSESVVLASDTTEEDKLELKLILGHAIRSMSQAKDSSVSQLGLENLFIPKEQKGLSEQDLKKLQERLRSWLLKNRLPVLIDREEPEVLVVADILRIQPPYSADSCQCTNEIVLGRIQGLIKNMPVEENPNACI